MKENISKLLDGIYELEGLLHLALNREVVDSHLAELILRKNRQTLESAEKLFGNRGKEAKEPEETEESKEVETAEIKEPEEIPDMQEASEEVEIIEETPEEEIQEEEKPEQMEIPEEKPQVSEVEEKKPEPEHEEKEEPVKPILNIESMEYSLEDEDLIPLPEENAKLPEENAVEVPAETKQDTEDKEVVKVRVKPEIKKPEIRPSLKREETKPKKASTPTYSINDRFLFIRELFDGDASAFNKAMEDVAAMDSFEEAESYFTDEKGLDEESDTAVRFFEILLAYFKKR